MADIILTKGFIATVDEEDAVRLARYSYHVVGRAGKEYAARWDSLTGKARYLHHDVLQVDSTELAEKGLNVDHINRNGLTNNKENLRIVNKFTNIQNSDRVEKQTGITYDAVTKKYRAYINIHKKTGTKRIYIGRFRSRQEAVEARIAYLNTPVQLELPF